MLRGEAFAYNADATAERLSEFGTKLASSRHVDEEVVDEDQFMKLWRDWVDAIGQTQARPQSFDAPRRHLTDHKQSVHKSMGKNCTSARLLCSPILEGSAQQLKTLNLNNIAIKLRQVC